MKKPKEIVLLLFVLAVFSFLNGCSDTSNTPVTPAVTTITVAGKVLDTYGNPITTASTVVIGTQTTTTGADGSFTINNVTTPYDIWVLNPTTGVFGVKGLTTTNPYIPGAISPGNTQSLLVTIPMVPAGSRATVIFQDTATGKVSGFGQVPANSQNAVLSIGGISGQSVTGKLYLLQYNINGGVVSSYTGYAEMPASFTIGSAPTFTFSSIGGGLGIDSVSGTVNSSGSSNLKAQLYINFGSKNNIIHKGGFIEQVAVTATSTTYNFKVPVGTSTGPLFNIVAITPDTLNVKQRMLTVARGTTGSIINIDASSNILTPGNGASNVDTTTSFSYTAGSSSAIHFVRVTSQQTGKTYQILTTGTSFTFPNLSTYGYNFETGHMYNYLVANNSDITDINAYCNQLFDINPAILGTTQSGQFTFTAR